MTRPPACQPGSVALAGPGCQHGVWCTARAWAAVLEMGRDFLAARSVALSLLGTSLEGLAQISRTALLHCRVGKQQPPTLARDVPLGPRAHSHFQLATTAQHLEQATELGSEHCPLKHPQDPSCTPRKSSLCFPLTLLMHLPAEGFSQGQMGHKQPANTLAPTQVSVQSSCPQSLCKMRRRTHRSLRPQDPAGVQLQTSIPQVMPASNPGAVYSQGGVTAP